MGEKMLDGFQSTIDNIVNWFNAFNDRIAGIQDSIAEQAMSTVNAFPLGGMYTQQAAPPINTTNVTQTVNVNEPVETAGMAARRLQKVNEELGAMIYGAIFLCADIDVRILRLDRVHNCTR